MKKQRNEKPIDEELLMRMIISVSLFRNSRYSPVA